MTTQKRYLRFAKYEARGSSPILEKLARLVAGDPELLTFLDSLPEQKRQPNLLFGATRWVTGEPLNTSTFKTDFTRNADAIRRAMCERQTQTNEPARMATLLPVLSAIKGPIALLEIGAAAGLCLYPDHYRYCYNTNHNVARADDKRQPRFHCVTNDSTPLPDAVPEIAWRAGLDLNPLDVGNQDEMDWLRALIWPEHDERLTNFNAAVDIAINESRKSPLRIDTGNLMHGLTDLLEQRPADTTLVVFHCAVLAYVDEASRLAHRKQMQILDGIWISNEHPALFPDIAARAPQALSDNQFLLSVNGEPVAQTGPHGQSIQWFEGIKLDSLLEAPTG